MSEKIDLTTYNPLNTKDLYEKNLNNDFAYIKKKFLDGKLKLYTTDTATHYQGDSSYLRTLEDYEIDFNTENFEHLREIIRVISEVFPNRWNIETTLTSKNNLSILGVTIHFPKIVLTNNKNEEHTLRDCYAHIPLCKSNSGEKNITLGRLLLGRSTQTRSEHLKSYSHSHQTDYRCLELTYMTNLGITRNFFRDMCLGDSNQGILKATREFNRIPTQENLISVLMNIIATIRYESLEGGPYRKIGEYFYNNSNSNSDLNFSTTAISQTSVKKLANILLRTALKNDPDLLLKFDIKSHPFLKKQVEFHDNLKLQQILIDSYKKLVEAANSREDIIRVVDSNTSSTVQSYLYDLNKLFYNATNPNKKIYFNLAKYYSKRNNISRQNNTNTGEVVIQKNSNPLFYFRGEPIYAKVIEDEVAQQEMIDIKNVKLEIPLQYFENIKLDLTNKILKNVLEQTQ